MKRFRRYNKTIRIGVSKFINKIYSNILGRINKLIILYIYQIYKIIGLIYI